MRVILCCGDRDWDDYKSIVKVLWDEHKKNPIEYIIEGGQRSVSSDPDYKAPHGADYQCRIAAQNLGIQVIECPANWEFHHKAAGPIRNQKQLAILCMFHNLGLLGLDEEIETEVIAFHSDIKKSKGTKDMVNRAKKAGVKVRVIK